MEQDKNKKQSEVVEYINDFPTEQELAQVELEKKQEASRLAMINKRYEQRVALKNKIKKIGLVVVIIFSVGAAFFLLFSNYKNKAQKAVVKKASVVIPENTDHVFVNDTQGVLPPVEVVDETRGLVGISENFQVKDLVFGGETMVVAGESENLPIKISDVRSETLMSKDGKEVKLLVSWKTNKLAKSSVRYRKDTLNLETVLKEGGYGFSHALILAKLDQSTRFFFTVDASDRQGENTSSETFAVFTGSKPVSVFDLISGEINKMFGWAIK